ncbi:hypothetical protein Y717_02710 [Streptomyces scopuliridis RB72]|uniref:Uncharacterized protein n=1 Tax=Streptomyces scopuliridis RB72 TaxID=1440053 RepID=A0A2T7T8R2_9ACTN|nr:hypothetical protein Y717_02710 [Streptomyces scopuliridis RB72]
MPSFTDASAPADERDPGEETSVVAEGDPVESATVLEEHAARATAVAAPVTEARAFFMVPVDLRPARRGSHC